MTRNFVEVHLLQCGVSLSINIQQTSHSYYHYHHHHQFNSRLLASFTSIFFLYSFQNRNFGNKQHGFLTARCPSCYPANTCQSIGGNTKYWPQPEKITHAQASAFHLPLDSWVNAAMPHPSAAWWWKKKARSQWAILCAFYYYLICI